MRNKNGKRQIARDRLDRIDSTESWLNSVSFSLIDDINGSLFIYFFFFFFYKISSTTIELIRWAFLIPPISNSPPYLQQILSIPDLLLLHETCYRLGLLTKMESHLQLTIRLKMDFVWCEYCQIMD